MTAPELEPEQHQIYGCSEALFFLPHRSLTSSSGKTKNMFEREIHVHQTPNRHLYNHVKGIANVILKYLLYEYVYKNQLLIPLQYCKINIVYPIK